MKDLEKRKATENQDDGDISGKQRQSPVIRTQDQGQMTGLVWVLPEHILRQQSNKKGPWKTESLGEKWEEMATA